MRKIYKLLYSIARRDYPAQSDFTVHLIVLWALVGIVYDMVGHVWNTRKNRW